MHLCIRMFCYDFCQPLIFVSIKSRIFVINNCMCSNFMTNAHVVHQLQNVCIADYSCYKIIYTSGFHLEKSGGRSPQRSDLQYTYISGNVP